MTDSLFNAELRDCARINERDLRVAQADWEAVSQRLRSGSRLGRLRPRRPLWRGVGLPRRAGVGLITPIRGHQVGRGACFAFTVSGEASGSKGNRKQENKHVFLGKNLRLWHT